jgi:acyl carrier protein
MSAEVTASHVDSTLSAFTVDTVRELLSDRNVFPGLPDDLAEDAELVLDSLGLVWLLHVVEERHGLVVEPSDEEISGMTSLRRLTDYLRAAERDGATEAAADKGCERDEP